jgi:hypothetical protein
MTKLILASLAAGALLLACGVSVARADGECNQEGGTFPNFVVLINQTCTLDGVTITGSVVVQRGGSLNLTGSTVGGSVAVGAGASLVLTDSTVDGALSANQCLSVQDLGSTVNGAFSTQGNGTNCTTDVEPSSIPMLGSNFSCTGTISCTVKSANITGSMTVYHNGGALVTGNTVGINAQVSNNGPNSATVELNQISGNLTCSSNTRLITSSTLPNTVGGTNSCKS